MNSKDKTLSSELLDYLFDELPKERKEEIEKEIIKNPDYGRMLISLSILKKRLGSKDAMSRHLANAKGEMLKRLRKKIHGDNKL